MARSPLSPIRQVQRKLLEERGLAQPERSAPVLAPRTNGAVTHQADGKSPLVLVIEDAYNMKIEEILFTETIARLAQRLHVSQATISRWRRQFRARSSVAS